MFLPRLSVFLKNEMNDRRPLKWHWGSLQAFMFCCGRAKSNSPNLFIFRKPNYGYDYPGHFDPRSALSVGSLLDWSVNDQTHWTLPNPWLDYWVYIVPSKYIFPGLHSSIRSPLSGHWLQNTPSSFKLLSCKFGSQFCDKQTLLHSSLIYRELLYCMSVVVWTTVIFLTLLLVWCCCRWER